MKEMWGNTRFAVVERDISRRLEKACRKRDPVCGNHLAREESIDFYQRIVEDLTGFGVTMIYYDLKREVFQFVFRESYAKDLEINVALASLPTCTRDLIRQTYAYIERMRDAGGEAMSEEDVASHSVLAHEKGKEKRMKRVLRARCVTSGAWLGVFPDNFAAVVNIGDAVEFIDADGCYKLDVRYEDLVKGGFLDGFIKGLHIFGDTRLKISDYAGREVAINVDRITEWHSQDGYTLITVGSYREVPVKESDAEVSDRIFAKLDELGGAQ